MVFIPIRQRNQIWDKYHFFSGTQLWLRAHGSAEKNNNRAWCARCMDHFERYWNICAKPACDRVHPVAVVTAGSHHSYGVDSITRRFRADGIMKVFFNDCQASNQYGLTTQRSDRGDRELRDAKKSGKCPHAGLHCSPRHTAIVCLVCAQIGTEQKNQTIKTAKKIKESNTTSIPLIPSHSKMKSKQSKSRDNPGKCGTLQRHP